jgi:hypothetical protein
MVMLLLPSAKEPVGKKMPNNKDNSNGKRNRFILTPGGKFVYTKSFFYHAQFLKAMLFMRGG